jgi:hypothetical protein
MARQIAPGTPGDIQALKIEQKPVDLSIFEKMGDNKIKAATAGFKLYAEATAKAESQKLYAQFKDDPINLSNALEKLPGMFKDLPEEMQAEVNSKLYLDSVSLVTKAQDNLEKRQRKETKATAYTNAQLTQRQLSDDYFNVLRNMTAPQEEKRPIDVDIYRMHRQSLIGLTNITDEEGKPLFSETERAKMAMPKDAVVSGFKQFIFRMEEKQLEDWDKTHFQNRERFIAETGIDQDTYDTMETALTKRLEALKDKTDREIHGQAYHDAAALITNPTEVAIEKAKGYDFANKNAIDSIVKAAKKSVIEKYYNPTRTTTPGAFMEAYAAFGEALKNNDWSYEGREKTLEQAAGALTVLAGLAKEYNLQPEKVEILKQTVMTAITDRQANQTILSSPIFQVPAGFSNKSIRDGEFLIKDTVEAAKQVAAQNYEENFINALGFFINGDMEQFNQAMANADRQYKKDSVGFIVKNNYEWERLEKALAEKQPAIIQYLGRPLTFKGFDNEGAIFEEIF